MTMDPIFYRLLISGHLLKTLYVVFYFLGAYNEYPCEFVGAMRSSMTTKRRPRDAPSPWIPKCTHALPTNLDRHSGEASLHYPRSVRRRCVSSASCTELFKVQQRLLKGVRLAAHTSACGAEDGTSFTEHTN